MPGDVFRPMAPLIFTPDARRMLSLALLQGDDDRLMPTDDSSAIFGLLADLGLFELVAGGYVATEALRLQMWADELRLQPFPD
jgi:hypothetical protein